MQDLIEYVARSLVDNTDAVRVTVSRDRSMKIYKLIVAPDETGRVIGKDGKIANALRILLRTAAARTGEQATLKIM
ncbi:MAG: KH domain-containing protein [Anaerolineae bacterium]|nr:KH domain-containing protein [Thermoflexales bacterium]MDW8406992.1 KH domain-containing protein [Anaerolineae bacterium]